MSGIAGYWGYSAEDMTPANFSDFTHSLAHRGPDGFGIERFPEARLWLGHRRLATTSFSLRARQPMSYADGRYWLTFDGAIYNHAALREELRGLGHRFRSGTDSEVVLAAYAQWGRDCLLRFIGMWAFAIWDARDRQLFLCRDRFGIKPLHYHWRAGGIAFASELKAFLALPWVDGALDSEILAETLADIAAQEASPETLLPHVRRLPPGRAMVIAADGSLRIETWWNTLDHLPVPAKDLQEQAEEFRALFFDACRLCLNGDAPLAVEQSGGLDLSAIACTVSELRRRSGFEDAARDRLRAFVACFTGTAQDERRDARLILDYTGMPAHFENVDDRRACDSIDKVVFDHEIIFGFPRVGPWALYRAMRAADIHASLNGIGVDDLLCSDPEDVEAGMADALEHRDWSRYRELCAVLRGLAGDDVPAGHAVIQGELRWLARHELERLHLLQPLRAVRARCQSLPAELRHVLISGDFSVPWPRGPFLRSHRGPARQDHRTLDIHVASMAPLRAKHFTDFHVGNALYLANFDRSAMAHGVELHMPFMDWRIVTYGFALPEASRTGGGHTKRLLRMAMTGLVPDPIRLRKSKVAFISPLDEWARGALKPWLLDLCASRSFLESTVWNGHAVRAAVERAVAGRASLWPVWPMLQAHALERGFVARAPQRASDESRPETQVAKERGELAVEFGR